MLQRLLRFFFQHLYHRLAWAYDLVAASVSLGQWQAWGRHALRHVRGPRVLEIGPGPGHLQTTLARLEYETFGLDESPQMLAQAAQRLKRNRQPQRLSRGLAQALPFASDYFDSALATFPSEYIMDTRTLAEVMRVLKPGGLFVVLPMAWPRGALRLLFRIARQAEPVTSALIDKMCAPFEKAGFAVSVEVDKARGVDLVFILARKPAPL